jgi:hypothetical protein
MYSICNAPSDRDYYGECNGPQKSVVSAVERGVQEHEENCEANRSAEEPQPAPNESLRMSLAEKQ